jgi:preprotein translocase subunit SecG
MAERSGGYGSRWKKWLLVYLAIGIVVYAIIYFVFIHNGSGGGSGGGLYTLFALPGPAVLMPEHRSRGSRHR